MLLLWAILLIFYISQIVMGMKWNKFEDKMPESGWLISAKSSDGIVYQGYTYKYLPTKKIHMRVGVEIENESLEELKLISWRYK